MPEVCPDVHALEIESERVLGEPLAQYPLRVTGTVRPQQDQLTLSLRITFPANAETRERELQALNCQELLEAAAVAIALAAAESGERQLDVSQSMDLFVPPPRAASVNEREQGSGLLVSLSGSSSWGTLPNVGLGAELQAAWRLSWLRIGLGATWLPLRDMPLASDVRASFALYFLEALLCGQGTVVRTTLFGCATAQAGRIDAHLTVPAVGPSESTPWRALSLRFGASYPFLPPLELTASVAAVMTFTRPRFYSEPTGVGSVHEPSAVSAQLLLGILLSL